MIAPARVAKERARMIKAIKAKASMAKAAKVKIAMSEAWSSKQLEICGF